MNITNATCPDIGRWRAWLDNEVRSLGLDAHLEGCPACQRAVADLKQDAALAASGLGLLSAPSVSHERAQVARERLAWRQRAAASEHRPTRRSPMRRWFAASGAVAAVLLTALIGFTPAGQTAAAAFLAQFRSRQVAPVEVSAQSQVEISRTLNTLGNLGTVQAPRGGSPGSTSEPTTLAEASRTVGFQLQTPDPATLPAGIDRTPTIRVVPASQMRFTFDKTKAQRYLEATGQPQVNLPDKFNGASLIVSTPAAAMLEYTSGSHQTLIIGQAGEIVVETSGQVTLEEMRDFLLSLPGLPPETVQQLRLIRSWGDTLPIPIPKDRINWQHATFKNRHQGLLLNDNTGIGSAAIWQADGHLYGLAGSLRATELKRVADSLAVR
jgi:anti-sigma factor RsiW